MNALSHPRPARVTQQEQVRAVDVARAILARPQDHDDDTLISQCRVLWGLGTLEDHQLANEEAFRIGQRRLAAARAMLPIADDAQAEVIRLERRANLRTMLVAILVTLVLIAVFRDVPARTAAAVLQAQEQAQW